jgi:hypothetical protein
MAVQRRCTQCELDAGAETRGRECDVAVRIVGPEFEALRTPHNRRAKGGPSFGELLVALGGARGADRSSGQRFNFRYAGAS